jgi:hypothetical protein
MNIAKKANWILGLVRTRRKYGDKAKSAYRGIDDNVPVIVGRRRFAKEKNPIPSSIKRFFL